MVSIRADFIRYNANTRNKDVGDCVKRGLAVAYSMDYDDVSAQLNKIKRDTGRSSYSQTSVYRKFCSLNGDKFIQSSDRPTEQEFCEQNPSGVYLLETGDKKDNYVATHLVAVVDGDIYDSWNSSGWYVKYYCKVSSGKSKSSDSFSYSDIKDDLNEYLSDYIDSLNNKFDLGYPISIENGFADGVIDQYTGRMFVVVNLDYKAPNRSKYRYMDSIAHRLTFKLNPRLSLEENLDSLKKKSKQKIYDWLYEVRKELKESLKIDDVEFNPSIVSSSSKKFVLQLPEWSWPLVTSVYINNDYDVKAYGYDKYEVYMEPLEGDPRTSEVAFKSDTLRQLKRDMELYKSSYARLNYDY